jgi:hypothetical protein
MGHPGWKDNQRAGAGNVALPGDLQAHRPTQYVKQLIDHVRVHTGG